MFQPLWPGPAFQAARADDSSALTTFLDIPGVADLLHLAPSERTASVATTSER